MFKIMGNKVTNVIPLSLDGSVIADVDINFNVDNYIQKINSSIGKHLITKSNEVSDKTFFGNINGKKTVSNLRDLLYSIGIYFNSSSSDQIVIVYDIIANQYVIRRILYLKNTYFLLTDKFLKIYKHNILTIKQKMTKDVINYCKSFDNTTPNIVIPNILKANIQYNTPCMTESLLFDSLFDEDDKVDLSNNMYIKKLCLEKIIHTYFETQLLYDINFSKNNKMIFDIKKFPPEYLKSYFEENNLNVDEKFIEVGIVKLI